MAKKPMMRSLGEFFGHVARGFRTPVGPRQPQTRVVREEVQEKSLDTPQGPVTLRRRTIDEVELPPRRN